MPVYALLPDNHAFPDPSEADADGLLAVGGDLSPERIIEAYARGIFPWYSGDTPILWWSPDPRCVLLPEDLHVPRSLQKSMRKEPFTFTLDRAFPEVINSCAAERSGTWLVPEMIDAYIRLHTLGIAHSIEAWREGELAGGLYGLSLGRVFFGESMFYRTPDASKAALVTLVDFLRQKDFHFIDCQQVTGNLLRFGATAMPREEFLERLDTALKEPTLQGRWTI